MAETLLKLIDDYKIPVVKIDESRNYWLVRTQSGEYYDQFYFENFIAIGWDEFNDIDRFKNTDKSILIKEIEKQYPDNKQPGLIYNQIHRFLFEMKPGDIVMIPSQNSLHISFGVIESHPFIKEVSETEIEEGVCPFKKRRKVKWVKTVKRKDLDPYLYKMMQSHHTINNANDYTDVIDRTLHSFYIKNGTAHLVLQVRKQDEIAAIDLINGINNILDLVPFIKNPLEPEKEYDKGEIELKLRVQSPGVIEFLSSGDAFWAILGVGMLLYFIVGGNVKYTHTEEQTNLEISSQGLLEKILKFKKHNDEQKLKELEIKNQETIRKLEIELPKETKNLPENLTQEE